MSKTFITSDWHLGETRMEIMGRPFTGPYDMLATMVGNHNVLVSPDDYVIVVGDACVDKGWLPYVDNFNGHKLLIRGNYDRQFTDEQLEPYFDLVIPEGQGLHWPVDIKYYITHYPSLGTPHYFNLVGHIHSAWKVQKNMLNVGVDVHHFKPVDMERIPFYEKAIAEFYDDDVWVADHDANAVWNTRGKEGSYYANKLGAPA